jgi:AGCS family alanine or glycine:cation symporter
VQGGGMQYLKKGFAELGAAPVGKALAVLFAVCCVFASFGGGNIFQVNQTTAQLVRITGGEGSFLDHHAWVFGLGLAILTGLVIIGGLKSIARVTDKLVPAMCLIYVLSAILVLIKHAGAIPGALSMIWQEAFSPRAAVTGGAVTAFIWGMRRATFSNEAGIGSAPIAHSAAKTSKPASEGVVALLEPFLDTVVVCTLTALVLCATMQFQTEGGAQFTINGQLFELGQKAKGDFQSGINMTSEAFETVHPFFSNILFLCVFLFAFSTLITWSYYGLQAWQSLFGTNRGVEYAYKLIFCLFIVVGSSASMSNANDFSDGALFIMSIPNLIGVYFLLPKVRKEYKDFLAHAREIDAKRK